MQKKELSSPSIEITKNKKYYTPPKIEAIGDVRDATRGSTLGDTDAGGHGANVPSDPG